MAILPPKPDFRPDGIDLDRSTLAGWVGQSTKLPEALADAIERYMRSGKDDLC